MKVTLITGASSGIGEAFARKLASMKHNLVLVARTEDKLFALCDELMAKHKITAHYVALDLLEYQADEKLFEETERHGLEVDWLINNAGFGSMGDFADLPLENELDMIGLNVMSLVALTHRYLKQMRERKSGTIINISSTASFQPIPFMSTYAATKAFVTSFSEGIAQENKKYGIRVLACCPGATETQFFDVAKIDKSLTVKGMQLPEDVVDATLKALKKGKSHVISGFANFVIAHLATVSPNSLITKVIGAKLSPKFQKK
jgi:uncharacterized protein